MSDTISYEIRPRGYDVFKNAKNIKQLDENFSRLYSTPKEYDLMLWRKRVNGKLKPIGLKKYFPPDLSPEGIMKEVIEIHGKTDFHVLSSGGKDSMSLVHFISKNYSEYFKEIVFIDTGCGITQTKEWLVEYAKEMGWPLKILHPGEEFSYTNFVLKNGFPSLAGHSFIMSWLKYRTMYAYIRTLPRTSTYISGTRKFESRRRSITTSPIDAQGSIMFVSPFYLKTDEEVYRYLLENGIKKTPVHDFLGRSGECMCGAFAQPNERELIKEYDPKLDKYFSWLEEQIRLGKCEERAKISPIWGKGRENYLKHKEKVDPNIEAIICGQECGGGTMRGLENTG